MKIYLDTEFSDLVPHARLISIALVNELGDGFYAELTDTYKLSDCSQFVKSHVLPYLRSGAYKMTRNECALRIADWIENHNQPCRIVTDAPAWDMPHLQRLLEPVWPENLDKNRIELISVPSAMEEAIVIEQGFDVHNALDDAMVMMLADRRLQQR